MDPVTGGLKIKIYKDEQGDPKGDCRVAYENIESVQMALEMLSDSEIRPGFPVHIELAQFEQKGEAYKPREVKKIDKIEKLRIKAEHERQTAWGDEEIHNIGLKIVVLENFYTYDEMMEAGEEYPELFKELELEIRSEVESKTGSIVKIEFFKDNPLGVCKIRF